MFSDVSVCFNKQIFINHTQSHVSLCFNKSNKHKPYLVTYLYVLLKQTSHDEPFERSFGVGGSSLVLEGVSSQPLELLALRCDRDSLYSRSRSSLRCDRDSLYSRSRLLCLLRLSFNPAIKSFIKLSLSSYLHTYIHFTFIKHHKVRRFRCAKETWHRIRMLHIG